ncbi:methyl-accepting chemotaxis protein [Fundidesulfovibrio agrisoli]|uniref:methyl-accepting chemotaxis protein n=1 Tax=Fundidesulfovibrio agrisoli TaxID=2922717 RepID=UPI001FAE66B2|nr:methyl-accepting chemotaxis protein [Fundidesulfovibrio agrisoli]
MKLSTKLILSFSAVLALMAVTSVAGIMAMRSINANSHEIATNWLPSVKVVGAITRDVQDIRRFEYALFVAESGERDAAIKRLGDISKSFDKNVATYEPLISSPEEKAIYTEFRSQWLEYLTLHKKFMDEEAAGNDTQAKKTLAVDAAKPYRACIDQMQKLIDLNDKGAATEAELARSNYERGLMVSITLFAAAALATLVIAFVLIRGVMRQLGEDPGYLYEVASKIAGGDLDVRFKDAKVQGGVYEVLRGMVGTLKQKIGEAEEKSAQAAREAEAARVATAEAQEAKALAERAKAEGMLQAAVKLEGVVEIVSSASEELSAQVEQSSHGAQDQAQRIGETATAMEEMNATVMEVARNASKAAETTEKAKDRAESGSKVVSRVVDGIGQVQNQALGMKEDMSLLGKQAEGIGQVMNVISDIADQTNLLALNAAIEAARAGEAGRGFAVVADEVRKLAEKTMTATKEVGEAIHGIQQGTQKNIGNVETTVKTINEATTLAGESGEALAEIVKLVEAATDQVRSIATASEQQSAASEEINRSIEDVSRISSETSDAMRQSAMAVSELANQAGVLRGLIEDMKSESGGAGGALPAGKPKALPGRTH